MTIWLWVAFLVLILGLLALDLGVLNRKDHVIGTREALGWTVLWIGLALLFNVGVYFMYEHHVLGIGRQLGHDVSAREAAINFLTGYLIEKSLSLDNIFVIALIFGYFRIPLQYQHRVLFWGILGALIMRGGMILAGTALIHHFWWTIYLFGGFLIFTAVRMALSREEKPNLEDNRLVRATRRHLPVSDSLHGHAFFTRVGGRTGVTPLFLVLVLVESTDVVFAVDSIPAIFAVTTDPFLVFTSNIFAILGLRSLYFVLASLLDRFRYLKLSLVFILGYVGVKMVLSHHLKIPAWISLSFIVAALAAGIVASAIKTRREMTAPSDGRGPEPG